jgi:hypothetical protein
MCDRMCCYDMRDERREQLVTSSYVPAGKTAAWCQGGGVPAQGGPLVGIVLVPLPQLLIVMVSIT